jgi:hypothetical protein
LLVFIGINLAPAEFKQGDVVTQREIPMAKHILMLTTVAFALVCGGIPARAQEDSDDPAITRHWEEAQQNQGDEEDTPMTGHGMMRHCMRQCMAQDGRMGDVHVIAFLRYPSFGTPRRPKTQGARCNAAGCGLA